jgi:hypothetical protein
VTTLDALCWGGTISLWLLVLLRMIATMRANRAPHQRPQPKRNTGGRRRNHTDRKQNP